MGDDSRCSFRLNKKSYLAYVNLRQWCRANRVPVGRMLNATLVAMQGMPNYSQMGWPKQATIVITYPQQTDVDDVIRYKKYKEKNEKNSRNRHVKKAEK